MSITNQENKLVHFAVQCANWAEKWFPDSWVFAASGLAVISTALFLIGAPPIQMVFVVIGGYVVASSPPVMKFIQRIVRIPNNGCSAIAMIAFLSMSASLINWGLSIVFCGLLVESLAGRKDLRTDYRAAAATG